MKQAYLAALCSGLVIPGLGQILNQQIKKGLILMGAVFVLFIAAAISLYGIVSEAFDAAVGLSNAGGGFAARLEAQDFTFLTVVLVLSLLLWAYAVIDALVAGARRDSESQGG